MSVDPAERRGYNRALADIQARNKRLAASAPATSTEATPAAKPQAQAATATYSQPANYTFSRPSVNMTTARQHVWIMLSLGIVVDFLARVDPLKTNNLTHSTRVASHDVNIVGWGVLFLFMTVLTDIESTTTLAQAFAFLIMVSALFLHGQAAATNLQNLIASNQPATTPKPAAK